MRNNLATAMVRSACAELTGCGPTKGPERMFKITSYRHIAALVLCLSAGSVAAGNCLVQNGQKIGDCDNVNVGTGQSLNVTRSGSYTGNFDVVTVQPGVRASVSGNTGDVLVRPGATLNLTGNSGMVRVEGAADLTGNTGPVFVASGGSVTVRGISESVSGPGRANLVRGAIVGGVQIK